MGVEKMANCQKYTKSATGHLSKHFERGKDINGDYIKFGNQDIDTEKSDLNYNLAPEHNQIDFIRQRCSEVQCLNRKDVNVMCSWVVTAPKNLDQAEEKAFFKHTYDFLADRYGEKNVVSAYVHLDEKSPHMHFAFVPVAMDKNKGIEKVSAKEVITRSDLQSFHTDLEKHLERAMGHEVDILNEATKEGNRSIDELKKGSAMKKVEELEIKKVSLQQELQSVAREQEKARQLLQEARGSIKPLEEQRNVLESEIEEYKALRGSVVDGVVEHKAMMGLGKVKTVTMPKETYDACVSAQLRADEADLRARRAEDGFRKIKQTSSHEQVQKLTKKVDDLEKRNRELAGELKQHAKVTDLVAKVFNRFPDVKKAFEVVKIQEQQKVRSRNQGLDRGR